MIEKFQLLLLFVHTQEPIFFSLINKIREPVCNLWNSYSIAESAHKFCGFYTNLGVSLKFYEICSTTSFLRLLRNREKNCGHKTNVTGICTQNPLDETYLFSLTMLNITKFLIFLSVTFVFSQ